MEKKDIIRIVNELGTEQEIKAFRFWLEQGGYDAEFDKLIGAELIEKLDKPVNDYKEEDVKLLLSQLKKRIPELSHHKHKSHDFVHLLDDVKTNSIWYAKIVATLLAFVFSIVFVFNKIDSNTTGISEVSFIEPVKKCTETGQKLTIQLPDGSKVILNSSSCLEYDSDFNSESRHVILLGEAYFDVVTDPEKPFIVDMDAIQVTALGTSFNISCRDQDIRIALTEGKVGILNEKDFNHYIELSPGEMAFSAVTSEGYKLKVIDFDIEAVTAWKDGKLTFKSKPLHQILGDLSKWYGVEFEYAGNVDLRKKVSGEFQNENLDNIMRGITFSLGLKYRIEDKKVMVQPK